jgi:hypothetical protein
MTIAILARTLPPLALALALGAAAAPARAAGSGYASATGRAGATPRAAGSGLGVSISGVQAGYPFSGGANYRVNGPSVIQPGAVWVPVRVTLRNDDAGNVAGRVAISDDPQGASNGNGNGGPSYRTDYTADVQLGQGARKAVTLYVRAADAGSQFTVSLLVGGKTVDSRTVPLSQQTGDTLAVGVLSDDTGVRPSFQGLKLDETRVAAAGLVALGGPNGGATPLDAQPQALDNFDLIVLSDYASDSLGGPQLDALRAWVRGGGTLLVAGGAHVRKTLGHLPPDLLAATSAAEGATTVVPSLPEVARLAAARGSGGGQTELSVAAPGPGATVILAHNGVPLIVDRPAGRGHLVYSALEPTAAPLGAFSDGERSAFWGRALAAALQGPRDALVQSGMQASSGSAFGPSGQNTLASVTSDVGQAYARGLPALQVYVFLIVLYVLALGPGNYLLLRWRRRLELSWVTVPVMAVLFGLGSFGLAYARNGGDVLANVDSVVYLDQGAGAVQADSYIGLFAPFRGDYDLTATDPNATPASTLAWGLGNDSGNQGPLHSDVPLGMRVDEGAAPVTAHLAGLQMWSQRNIGLHRQLPLQGDVAANLALRGKAVDGTVTNRTAMTLRDCMVVGANGVSALISRIAPGATVRVPPFGLGGAGSGGAPGSGNGNGAPAGPLNGLYSGVPASGMLASAKRYNDILGAVFPGGSVATVATPLALIGWANSPIGAFVVNGAAPRRTDLDLVVVPLGLGQGGAPGSFALSPGDLPVGVAGTTVTQGNGSNGLMLNAGDRIDVQLALPATARGHARRVDTLSLVVNPTNGSSSLASSTARLWNWRARRWQGVDLSGGSLDVHRAAPYVSDDGRVLLRLEAPSGGGLSFNNVDQNIQIGAAGSVS